MQIIQKTTRIIAQEEVQGTNVMYSYEFEKEQNPQAVAFSVQKNIETQGSYPYLSGTVTEHDFNMQNNNFQPSDIDLIKHIHTTCTAIIKGENTEKPKANGKEK
nr:MAG TPA: hypothetical protein [Caudoviricetes sp.]